LDAIPDLQWASPQDEEPAGNVRDQIFESNGQAGRKQPEERCQRLNTLEPYPANKQDAENHRDVRQSLSPSIARTHIFRTPEHNSLGDHPENPKEENDEN
jgi:hypothetical protein